MVRDAVLRTAPHHEGRVQFAIRYSLFAFRRLLECLVLLPVAQHEAHVVFDDLLDALHGGFAVGVLAERRRIDGGVPDRRVGRRPIAAHHRAAERVADLERPALAAPPPPATPPAALAHTDPPNRYARLCGPPPPPPSCRGGYQIPAVRARIGRTDGRIAFTGCRPRA